MQTFLSQHAHTHIHCQIYVRTVVARANITINWREMCETHHFAFIIPHSLQIRVCVCVCVGPLLYSTLSIFHISFVFHSSSSQVKNVFIETLWGTKNHLNCVSKNQCRPNAFFMIIFCCFGCAQARISVYTVYNFHERWDERLYSSSYNNSSSCAFSFNPSKYNYTNSYGRITKMHSKKHKSGRFISSHFEYAKIQVVPSFVSLATTTVAMMIMVLFPFLLFIVKYYYDKYEIAKMLIWNFCREEGANVYKYALYCVSLSEFCEFKAINTIAMMRAFLPANCTNQTFWANNIFINSPEKQKKKHSETKPNGFHVEFVE